jgi:hypothetical protein
MTAAAAIPHQRIRELRDRSWTAVLLEALHGASRDERAEIGETLGVLADPRAVPALTAIVVSSSGAPALRELAGALLRAHGDAPPAEVLLRWWDRGDRVLRRHALRSMPAGSLEVLEVAGDPGHPMHVDAIGELALGYEEPAHQQLKIAALAHADPRVRVAAAEALVYDEPRAAEAALIAALEDGEAEVALAARATLVYYDSRKALRALVSVPAPTGAEGFAEAARHGFGAALAERSRPVRNHLALWLRPVADLVSVRDLVGAVPPVRRPDSNPAATGAGPGADELRAVLDIVDGPWALPRADLDRVDPRAIAAADRDAIAARAAGHPDAEVRELAARWLAIWGDEPRLRGLLDDDAGQVRRAAAGAAAALPRSPALAEHVRAHLGRLDVAGVHALETLRAYSLHAAHDDRLAALVELATGDRREAIRAEAIDLLTGLGARDALAPMMAHLGEPPRVTWAVHVALLDAARRLALPAAEALALVDVDSLAVQLALAELATSS